VELGQLEAFIEAARRGNFRQAAEALFISQPSLSARIGLLERELGERLFDRLGRGVRLTPAGELFLPYAERALEILRQGREALAAARRAAAGTLQVGCARVVGTYVLPEIITAFRRRYPQVEVHVRTGRSSEILQLVVDQTIHIGLARALNHPMVWTHRLYDEEIVLVSHPAHPFARTGVATIQQVAEEPLILYDRGSSYFVLIEQVCHEAGIIPRIEMVLDSVEATKRMVERGLGISFLPRSSIREEIRARRLKVIDLADGHRVFLPTAVMVRRAAGYPTTVLAFLDVLAELYGVEAGLRPDSPVRRPDPASGG
jgi:DNA-binding transcriptional LysR family regulator